MSWEFIRKKKSPDVKILGISSCEGFTQLLQNVNCWSLTLMKACVWGSGLVILITHCYVKVKAVSQTLQCTLDHLWRTFYIIHFWSRLVFNLFNEPFTGGISFAFLRSPRSNCTWSKLRSSSSSTLLCQMMLFHWKALSWYIRKISFLLWPITYVVFHLV